MFEEKSSDFLESKQSISIAREGDIGMEVDDEGHLQPLPRSNTNINPVITGLVSDSAKRKLC